MAFLELKNLSISYGIAPVLSDVSIQVGAGEIVTILGANGAGKTTMLRAISGLLHPSAGEIWFDGSPLHRLAPEQIVRQGVVHVPEGRRIFPGLTVRENLLMGASNRAKLSRRQIEQDADEMLKLFPEIAPFSNSLGWTLSGGQQQMLAVARGLMAQPKLLLLDEPSLGLAPVIVQNLFAAIRQIHARGVTILLVEQNANIALSVATRGYVLETGSVTVSGTPDELKKNDEIRHAYLGGKGDKILHQ
ncbi:MAG: ABC transporter ATP-binding protein [Burkholderiaceae bacterium]|nr:ABC transporter ATP-binding protein [Burkholderiaceae bacterium]MBU6291823.1 ABC transporter ATP-binding protein [Burkholderiales bacterium]NCW86956.1 ABC transporter ATP-binding protein [Oxalobacteraceae bacterium]NDG07703.1 ABC transporter ATP-binding protein [Oxalobacteraceae bacterium]